MSEALQRGRIGTVHSAQKAGPSVFLNSGDIQFLLQIQQIEVKNLIQDD